MQRVNRDSNTTLLPTQFFFFIQWESPRSRCLFFPFLSRLSTCSFFRLCITR